MHCNCVTTAAAVAFATPLLHAGNNFRSHYSGFELWSWCAQVVNAFFCCMCTQPTLILPYKTCWRYWKNNPICVCSTFTLFSLRFTRARLCWSCEPTYPARIWSQDAFARDPRDRAANVDFTALDPSAKVLALGFPLPKGGIAWPSAATQKKWTLSVFSYTIRMHQKSKEPLPQ
jgi:hypothetical protein